MSGAVIRQVEVNGTTYSLAFKFGTMRTAEKEIGRGISDWGAGLDVMSAVFWAALQPKHNMTRDAADNLVDDMGIKKLSDIIGEGIAAYMDPGSASEGNADPAPKAKAKSKS